MKKGKPKPYVKKESNTKKYMILFVAGIMVFSGLYFGLRSAQTETQNNANNAGPSIMRYNVQQVGSDVIVFVVQDNPEVIALAGEKASLDQNSLAELMNLTSGAVYSIDGESSNTYTFFRFYTTNVGKAVEELSPRLDSILRDYKLYQGYIGVQPGDRAMENKIYLLGSLNITKGSLVKILVFEKSQVSGTDAGSNLGYIGFIRSVIPIGPVVNAKVNSIESTLISGITTVLQNVSEINGSIGDLKDISYQSPYFIVQGILNESALNLTGIEVLPQGNDTIVNVVGNSADSVEGRIKELSLNYTIKEGVVAMVLPLNADVSSAKQILSDRNVTNITEQRYGSIILPEEILFNATIVPIANNNNFTALLSKNAKKGDSIRVNVLVMSFGDQYLVNAQQV